VRVAGAAVVVGAAVLDVVGVVGAKLLLVQEAEAGPSCRASSNRNRNRNQTDHIHR